MSETSGDDTTVSESGGTMRLLSGAAGARPVDLTLDLWLEPGGELWLKDADEVEVAVECGRYPAVLADEIRAAADWARVDLVQARAWPLDEEWTTWRPPADWTVVPLPDGDVVHTARAATLPR